VFNPRKLEPYFFASHYIRTLPTNIFDEMIDPSVGFLTLFAAVFKEYYLKMGFLVQHKIA